MRQLIARSALLVLLLAPFGVANAGITFIPGSNVTPERLAALNAAAAEIEQVIDFKQNIKVSVSFTALQCTDFSAVLGFAGLSRTDSGAYANFPGAPQSNVWYVAAQAADMGHAAAMDDSVHIQAEFNHNLGNSGCLGGVTWYFGTDHNPAFGQVDFISTAVHEFMHGLGFLSLIKNDGKLNGGLIDNYSTFLLDNSTGKSWKAMTAGERAASILNNHNLVWNGSKTTSMVSLLQAGTTAGKARIYAPSAYEQGSSTSHFDVSLFYDTNEHEVMEPIAESPEDSTLASAAFCDMGWQLLRDTDGDGTNDCDDTDPLVAPVLTDTDGDGTPDAQDAFPNDPTETTDSDSDGIGNNADPDDDNDTIADAADNCPSVSNASQLDYDEDGTGDACGDPLPMPGVTSGVSKDNTGAAVAFAGDVDADGYGDYVIGIPKHDVLSPVLLKDAGMAVVISGRNGAELMSIEGSKAKDAMGFAVAGGGDVDGDGFDDVVVGAPKADNLAVVAKDAGSVTVLYGPDGARQQVFRGEQPGALFGSAVVVGDINADGKLDLLVGAPKDSDLDNGVVRGGSVTVFSGPLLPKRLTIYGAADNARFGTGIAVGAINAVAGDDVVVGAPGEGSVAVYDLSSDILVLSVLANAGDGLPSNDPLPFLSEIGSTVKSRFGAAVAVGDVDADGRDDVIVGAPADDSSGIVLKDAGSVSVYSGATGNLLVRKFGDRARANLGTSVAAGDVNGDGHADIIGGAAKDDDDMAQLVKDTGSVTVWDGDGFADITKLYGGASKDYFGMACSAGDINGDGKADLLVGASGDDIPADPVRKDAGSVQLFSGADL